MEISKEYADVNAPVISAFAVDLLYPGLDLEIDAMAIIDPNKKILSPSDLGGRYQPTEFPDGIDADGEIYVAGQTALQQNGSILPLDDISKQTKEVFHRMKIILEEADAALTDVVKLNLFIVADDHDVESAFHQVCQIWTDMCPDGHPAMTSVRVHELAQPGLLIQADCIAIKGPFNNHNA